MTCRIDRRWVAQGAVLRVSGRLTADGLAVFRAALDEGAVVAIELAEIELVDLDAVNFLALEEANGLELWDCPAYVREWITRERGRS